MARFDIIAFDADDTLWHNEHLYFDTQAKFKELLSQYHSPEWIGERLFATEMRNLPHFGYGIKAFALSMIETAVELTEGRITGHDIQTVVDLAKAMLSADVELLPQVADTIAELSQTCSLMVITKGDLRDQEAKIARSGLAPYFRFVEVVSDKRRDTYERILQRAGVSPDRFLMVGNSLRSDILPLLELGASAVYIPYPLVWAHEAAELPARDHPGFYELENVALLPGLLQTLAGWATPPQRAEDSPAA